MAGTRIGRASPRRGQLRVACHRLRRQAVIAALSARKHAAAGLTYGGQTRSPDGVGRVFDGISSLLLMYIVVGPVAWALLGASMLAGRRRMMLLERPAELPEPAPSVALLVPAKDEEARIAECIASVLGQDYPNFRIVAINDRSEDCTGATLDDLARAEPRLTILHVPHGALPAGWTGKCHALHLAWKQHVRSEWI